ncbi:relaxase domain-containing protein [Streptomyces termitum]|uniref:relaxase domain-containing protein n=1 Tax=Streptomyces termitum TaxID=67368 RepID=UPI00339E005D
MRRGSPAPSRPLKKLAGAASVGIAAVFTVGELAHALVRKEDQVGTRVCGFDLVLDVPKSDSVMASLLPEGAEAEYRDLVHEAARDAVAQYDRWIAYLVGGQDGEMVRLSTGGLLAWATE